MTSMFVFYDLTRKKIWIEIEPVVLLLCDEGFLMKISIGIYLDLTRCQQMACHSTQSQQLIRKSGR